MTSNVVCRYFAQGNCAFGDRCRFSHESREEPSQVCKFFQQGNCAYGDRCRFQHSSTSGAAAPASVHRPGAAASAAGRAETSTQQQSSASGGAAPDWNEFMTPDEMDEFESWVAEQEQLQPGGAGDAAGDDEGDVVDPGELPLCREYAESGTCSAGDDCLYVHGDTCELCGYFCLHPYNPDWTAQHIAACREACNSGGGLANGASGSSGGLANGGSSESTAAAADEAADVLASTHLQP